MDKGEQVQEPKKPATGLIRVDELDDLQLITKQEAKIARLSEVVRRVCFPAERWMMRNAFAPLKKAGVTCYLLRERDKSWSLYREPNRLAPVVHKIKRGQKQVGGLPAW